MKAKRTFPSIIFSCTMVLALLTACSGHTHSPFGGWVSDAENHWHTCACGEPMDTAAHTLKNDVCTVCGNEIFIFEDGTKQMLIYNEQGDCIRCVSYAADGSMESEDRTEYVYDNNGNKLSEKTYSTGALFAEYEYATSADGETYMAKETYYNADGTRHSSEYDENWNTLHSASYAADGSVEYAYEYEYSADGSWMGEKSYQGDMLISEQEYLLDAEGSQTTIRHIFYNEDGSSTLCEYDEYGNETLEITYDAAGNVTHELRYEYEYDENGNQISGKGYENGRLFEQAQTIIGSDGETESVFMISYDADGGKIVREYDNSFDLVKETIYDAYGNVISES